MGRHYFLSRGDPRYATHLVSSNRPGEKEDCSKDEYVGYLLNKKIDLSIRNGVLLYKQLIRSMMDYTCPAPSFAARSRDRRLHVLKSKSFRLTLDAPLYVCNRQIHEDLSVPLFADHTRALTEGFDTNIVDLGNTLVRQLGRYLSSTRFDPFA